jgi:putative endonuclease
MYYVYLLECSDFSYYCGITTDIERRVHEHNHSKKSAKYTRSRRPVKLIWSKIVENRSEATRLEIQIKKLSKKRLKKRKNNLSFLLFVG